MAHVAEVGEVMKAKLKRKPKKSDRDRQQVNRVAAAIGRATRQAVERHAKLGESVATIRDGSVQVIPAARIIGPKRGDRAVPK